MILPPDLTVECGQPLPAPWSSVQQAVAAGADIHDNCELNETAFKLLSETASSTFCPYTLTRIYRIADAAGNTATAAHHILVTGEDGEAPPPVEEVRRKGAQAGLTITAVNSGNWNTASTWSCNCIPDNTIM